MKHEYIVDVKNSNFRANWVWISEDFRPDLMVFMNFIKKRLSSNIKIVSYLNSDSVNVHALTVTKMIDREEELALIDAGKVVTMMAQVEAEITSKNIDRLIASGGLVAMAYGLWLKDGHTTQEFIDVVTESVLMERDSTH